MLPKFDEPPNGGGKFSKLSHLSKRNSLTLMLSKVALPRPSLRGGRWEEACACLIKHKATPYLAIRNSLTLMLFLDSYPPTPSHMGGGYVLPKFGEPPDSGGNL